MAPLKPALRLALLALAAMALSGCCDSFGKRWLGSCGLGPSVSHMNVVAECIEAGHQVASEQYVACLNSKGVIHGFR